MLPTIFPMDRLHVREATPDDLVPGAIVTFPNSRREMVAHRILQVEGTPPQLVEVRGDGQTRAEWIEARSIVHVVLAVEGALGRWRVAGRRGRLWSKLALSDRTPVLVPLALLLWRGLRLYRASRSPGV
jgi:hypothetical protein